MFKRKYSSCSCRFEEKNSKTYKKYFSINLYSKNRYSLIIPPLCANAFLTLEDNSMIHYYMGDYFDNKKYKGFRFNDPSFNIKWPFDPVVINKRDKITKTSKFNDKKILITGIDGFLEKNFIESISNNKNYKVLGITRKIKEKYPKNLIIIKSDLEKLSNSSLKKIKSLNLRCY